MRFRRGAEFVFGVVPAAVLALLALQFVLQIVRIPTRPCFAPFC